MTTISQISLIEHTRSIMNRVIVLGLAKMSILHLTNLDSLAFFTSLGNTVLNHKILNEFNNEQKWTILFELLILTFPHWSTVLCYYSSNHIFHNVYYHKTMPSLTDTFDFKVIVQMIDLYIISDYMCRWIMWWYKTTFF